jgi:hypothetical protein
VKDEWIQPSVAMSETIVCVLKSYVRDSKLKFGLKKMLMRLTDVEMERCQRERANMCNIG